MNTPPICLSIAGSDPSGGAGIQADLKTFAALGCYGEAAITAITVQNTLGVQRSVPIEASLVYEQVEAVLTDLRPHAIKIGMVCSIETIEALASLFEKYTAPFIVLDPIIVSSSGRVLLDMAGCQVLLDNLTKICHLLTPNVPELLALTGASDIDIAAHDLVRDYGIAVLVKGGHLKGEPIDTLYTPGGQMCQYASPRINTCNDHGTGCTLSSAIAAYMARGLSLVQAVSQAKIYLSQALFTAKDLNMGKGHGAMNHTFAPQPLIRK